MIEYPPPHERIVWDYKKANIDSIQKALKQVNWRFLFSNKSVHQQVKILSSTPKKLVTFNDKGPPWASECLKKKIKWRNKLYVKYVNEDSGANYITLQNVTAVSELACKSKDDYYKQLARNLANPKTSSKTCWSILKTFYN